MRGLFENTALMASACERRLWYLVWPRTYVGINKTITLKFALLFTLQTTVPPGLTAEQMRMVTWIIAL